MPCQDISSEGEATQKSEHAEANCPSLTVGDALTVLSNDLCRDLLTYLTEQTRQPVSLEMAIDHLAQSGENPQNRVSGDQMRQEIQISLLHNLLPKLEEKDVVEYDQEAETLTYFTDPTLEAFLDLCREIEN